MLTIKQIKKLRIKLSGRNNFTAMKYSHNKFSARIQGLIVKMMGRIKKTTFCALLFHSKSEYFLSIVDMVVDT